MFNELDYIMQTEIADEVNNDADNNDNLCIFIHDFIKIDN